MPKVTSVGHVTIPPRLADRPTAWYIVGAPGFEPKTSCFESRKPALTSASRLSSHLPCQQQTRLGRQGGSSRIGECTDLERLHGGAERAGAEFFLYRVLYGKCCVFQRRRVAFRHLDSQRRTGY
jgi:hypothetical protein